MKNGLGKKMRSRPRRTADNIKVSDEIQKYQRSNFGKRARSVTVCRPIHFVACGISDQRLACITGDVVNN
jgi:hypothetical protein